MQLRIGELKAEILGPCTTYGCVHDFHLHRKNGWNPVGSEDCLNIWDDILAVAVVEH